MRGFNALILHGIDNNWQKHTITVGFEHLEERHTGDNIKKQYDKIMTSLGIINNVMKFLN